MELSEDLKKWRSDRPDEWTMDRFIEKALAQEGVLKHVFTYGNATNTHLDILDYLFEKGVPKSEYSTWGRNAPPEDDG